MHTIPRILAAALCAAATASAVHAQQVRGVPNTVPSASARAAAAAPNPAGLRPLFPAGVSSGSGARVSTDPIAATTSPIGPGGPGAVTTTTGTFGAATTITPELANFGNASFGAASFGAAVVGGAGNTVPGPAQRNAGGAGGVSAVEQARAFILADANRDNELTRAEARRLSIMTMSFEEMDRNFDQVISRFEYEDSFR